MHIENEYKKHGVFKQLERYISFYEQLAFSICSQVSRGTLALIHIDSYVYSSMAGSLKSMKEILVQGRINDTYALLRKYYDLAIINIYCNLYFYDNLAEKESVVEKINCWLKGEEKLPEFRYMYEYILNSQRLMKITELLYKDDTYRETRMRCNDHVHYNFYQNVLLNNSELYLKDRLDRLDFFSRDLENIFILHLSYIFFLNDHYMMAKPDKDDAAAGRRFYPIASFVREIFESVIYKSRPDLVGEIALHSDVGPEQD